MKDELVQLLVEKVGLERSLAETVVHEVVAFLGEKLPSPYDGIVKQVLGGETTAGDDGFGLDDAANLLSGLLGGKN